MSKYSRKIAKREQGICGPNSIYKSVIEQKEESHEIITKQSISIASQKTSHQEYGPVNGFITTSNGIRVGIDFLSNPNAIRITPYLKEKEIRYLLFREKNKKGTYSISEYAGKRWGNSKVSADNIFGYLYETSWITSSGNRELNAIKEVLNLRQTDIEKFTGLELRL